MLPPTTPLTPITSTSSTDTQSISVTLSNDSLSNSLKRKRSHSSLSSPPPEPHELDFPKQAAQEHLVQEQEGKRKEQGTQTGLDLLQTRNGPAWTGRGRSPYKIPVTAVLDGIKNQTACLEHFERELFLQQAELDDLIKEKRASLESVKGRKVKMSVEAPPGADFSNYNPSSKSRGRSTSPDKYLTKLALASPPIIPRPFTNPDGPLPQLIKDLVMTLLKGLGDGCMPSEFKVRLS
jgi:hypothetical protein